MRNNELGAVQEAITAVKKCGKMFIGPTIALTEKITFDDTILLINTTVEASEPGQRLAHFLSRLLPTQSPNAKKRNKNRITHLGPHRWETTACCRPAVFPLHLRR